MNRNIIELLKVLKKELTEYNNFQEGLCSLIDKIFNSKTINKDEAVLIFKYIDNNRPTFKPTPDDIYEMETIFSIISLENGSWGWYPGLKDPRIEWIDERIKIENNAQSKLVKS